MAQRFSRKQLKHDEFVEAAFDIGHWLEQHWKNVVLAAGAVAVIAFAVWGWWWMAEQRRVETERKLASGIAQYERAELTGFVDVDALAEALAAFEDVSGSGGAVGNVARFYRASTLRQLGRTAEALEVVQAIADPTALGTLGGVVELLRVNLLVEVGRGEEALTLLGELSEREDGGLPADQALLELAQVHFERGELDEARQAWERIVERYPDRSSAAEARRRLELQ